MNKRTEDVFNVVVPVYFYVSRLHTLLVTCQSAVWHMLRGHFVLTWLVFSLLISCTTVNMELDSVESFYLKQQQQQLWMLLSDLLACLLTYRENTSHLWIFLCLDSTCLCV